MTTAAMRRTGVDVVGDMPWGTHFCAFYDTQADLLETLVPYCRAGLESEEFCLWVVASPLTEQDALRALKEAVPGFDRYLREGSIEIVAARDWYLRDGRFDLQRVIRGWNEKLARASARGYAGVRVTGDTAWLEKNDWKNFVEYEESLNVSIANQRMAVLCTYPLHACGSSEILDVVRTHQFAVTKRGGSWEVIETAGYKQAKAEIKRLNEDLERRVAERTSQLTAVNDQLINEAHERRRAEEALRRSEAYLADAQRLTHTGSWAFNVATREMLHSSKEHSRLYGFDPNGGLPSFGAFQQRIVPDDRPQVIESLERANSEGTDVEVYYRVVRPDGTTRHMHTVGHPLRQASGDAGEYLGISMDVTEQRQAERERETLRQVEADLAHVTRVTTMGELTASLAHEIKQPITAAVIDAQACLRWLGREQPDLAEARDAASRVIKDATRASDIINRIRMIFVRAAPERELLDVNEIIQEMIGLLREEASRRSVSIHSELASALPHILADRVQLQQVLMNLMLNGIESMKDTGAAGHLTISSRQDDDRQIVVAVSDSGVGLAPAESEQIFRAFFTTKPHGTGMGLSISRSIIESYGGRLWATSNAGPGATFQFTLPIDFTANEAT
ncbi:MAG: multi-sensor signal transduction histidine kinase [Gemmatimonadetes bacterium]|nr:multi-sensor signal transduction histidine kinase [Gemmatimonadota bacterium]